jgi:hypothetical protein
MFTLRKFKMSKQLFIINSTTGSLSGVVASVKNLDLTNSIAVSAPDDLTVLSLGTLTTIFNSVTGESKGTFKIAKAKAVTLVFDALKAVDVTSLIHLDKAEQKAVVEQSAKVATPGVRKVRDSKLQRMAGAFRSQDDAGAFKQWSVKELMEKCGTTEKITHQYISILRAKNDRFVMDIVKDKALNTFVFAPQQAQ